MFFFYWMHISVCWIILISVCWIISLLLLGYFDIPKYEKNIYYPWFHCQVLLWPMNCHFMVQKRPSQSFSCQEIRMVWWNQGDPTTYSNITYLFISQQELNGIYILLFFREGAFEITLGDSVLFSKLKVNYGYAH